MKRIPNVKRWLVTLDNGDQTEIWAPTRLLAIMNYRHQIGYGPIKSVTISRRNPLPDPVANLSDFNCLRNATDCDYVQ